MSITMSVAMTVVSIAGLSSGRSLRLPFAIVSMMSIASIAITMTIAVSIAMSVVSIAGLGISRSLSLPLAVVMSIASIAISMAVTMAITMAVAMAIIAIAGLGKGHSEEGDSKSNQKFHVICSSFSTELPM